MEIQFEIVSDFSRKDYVEMLRYRMRFRWIYVIVSTFIFGYALWVYYRSRSPLILLYTVLLVLYTIFVFCRPWIVARSYEKRDRDLGPSVTRFDDKIRDENSRMTIQMDYSQLKMVRFLPNVIFMYDGRVLIFFSKNGFTKGSFEEFVPFIQKKCPQIKLPKKLTEKMKGLPQE